MNPNSSTTAEVFTLTPRVPPSRPLLFSLQGLLFAKVSKGLLFTARVLSHCQGLFSVQGLQKAKDFFPSSKGFSTLQRLPLTARFLIITRTSTARASSHCKDFSHCKGFLLLLGLLPARIPKAISHVKGLTISGASSHRKGFSHCRGLLLTARAPSHYKGFFSLQQLRTGKDFKQHGFQ